MTFTDILTTYRLSQAELHRRYNIPLRTMEAWKAGDRAAPDYVLELLDYRLRTENGQPPD